MKTLLDLCEEYGIPILEKENRWVGPCIWSFDEQQSLTIDPLNERWDDWITGHCGDIIDFVTLVEERLRHLGRSRFSSEDWFAEVEEPCPF